MKDAPMITKEQVQALRESSGEGLMTCNKILSDERKEIQKGYANDALFEAIHYFKGGCPDRAFDEIIEVLGYLVNRG